MEMAKFHVLATLVERRSLAPDIVRLVLEAPEIARSARPGQFVAVRVAAAEAPLLRRPFSIASADGRRTIGLIFRIVGTGTGLLAERRVGDRIDLIGPLGRGFEIRDDLAAVLVAGGMGIPPIAFLARRLGALEVSTTLFYGVRTRQELAVLDGIEGHVGRLFVSTDDGTAGFHGPVSDLVERNLERHCCLYACGPRPMVDAIVRLARARNVPAQVSLEQHMACGVGACMGCSIETAQGYRRVCTDGPVFPAEAFFY